MSGCYQIETAGTLLVLPLQIREHLNASIIKRGSYKKNSYTMYTEFTHDGIALGTLIFSRLRKNENEIFNIETISSP